MSTFDPISHLSTSIDELREEVRSLKHDYADFPILKSRVVALEENQRATGQRLSHMDSILIEVQADVRGLKRAMNEMQLSQTKKLDELHEMMKRVIDLVQPKAVL